MNEDNTKFIIAGGNVINRVCCTEYGAREHAAELLRELVAAKFFDPSVEVYKLVSTARVKQPEVIFN